MSRKQVGRYILEKRIGKGSYAQVWLGHSEDSDEKVAVKVISRHTVNETAQLRQEVAVLKRIDHINIVRFKDLKKSVGHYYLVLEYCAGGDLARFIRTHGKVKEVTAQRFLRQLSGGLLVLHRLSFIHRDLKPQNILLSEDSEEAILKIADFGFARFLDATDMAATVCGSPLYMAPEILRHERYDARADLWSLGTIVYELLFGVPPYTGSNPMQLLNTIENGPSRVTLPTPTELSEEGAWLLQAALARDPSERIAPDQFFSHAYNLGQSVDLNQKQPEPSIESCLDEITLIEEASSPVASESSPKAVEESSSSEPVVVLTGLTRALSEALSLQSKGSLADTYAGTQVALGVILRFMAEEVAKKPEEETNFVDSLGIVFKSCEFFDTALDSISDRVMESLVELELKTSIELAQEIQSKLSYRGFSESAHPLRWVFAFTQSMAQESAREQDEGKKELLQKATVLMCDFLLSEFEQLSASTKQEEEVKDRSEDYLRGLRNSLT